MDRNMLNIVRSYSYMRIIDKSNKSTIYANDNFIVKKASNRLIQKEYDNYLLIKDIIPIPPMKLQSSWFSKSLKMIRLDIDLYNYIYHHFDKNIRILESEKIKIGIQIIYIVMKLHTLGFIHNDIKAENFVLNLDLEVFLIDLETMQSAGNDYYKDIYRTYDCLTLLFESDNLNINNTIWNQIICIFEDKNPDNWNNLTNQKMILSLLKTEKY